MLFLEDGVWREATQQEIEDMQAYDNQQAQQSDQPLEPTPEERIAELEKQLVAAKIVLGVDE